MQLTGGVIFPRQSYLIPKKLASKVSNDVVYDWARLSRRNRLILAIWWHPYKFTLLLKVALLRLSPLLHHIYRYYYSIESFYLLLGVLWWIILEECSDQWQVERYLFYTLLGFYKVLAVCYFLRSITFGYISPFGWLLRRFWVYEIWNEPIWPFSTFVWRFSGLRFSNELNLDEWAQSCVHSTSET